MFRYFQVRSAWIFSVKLHGFFILLAAFFEVVLRRAGTHQVMVGRLATGIGVFRALNRLALMPEARRRGQDGAGHGLGCRIAAAPAVDVMTAGVLPSGRTP